MDVVARTGACTPQPTRASAAVETFSASVIRTEDRVIGRFVSLAVDGMPGARQLFVFGFGEAALALLGAYYLARSREHHVRQSSAHERLQGSATA